MTMMNFYIWFSFSYVTSKDLMLNCLYKPWTWWTLL